MRAGLAIVSGWRSIFDLNDVSNHASSGTAPINNLPFPRLDQPIEKTECGSEVMLINSCLACQSTELGIRNYVA